MLQGQGQQYVRDIMQNASIIRFLALLCGLAPAVSIAQAPDADGSTSAERGLQIEIQSPSADFSAV